MTQLKEANLIIQYNNTGANIVTSVPLRDYPRKALSFRLLLLFMLFILMEKVTNSPENILGKITDIK